LSEGVFCTDKNSGGLGPHFTSLSIDGKYYPLRSSWNWEKSYEL
jgi:hypothetical protein